MGGTDVKRQFEPFTLGGLGQRRDCKAASFAGFRVKHFGSAGAVRDHAVEQGFFPGPVAEDAF